MLSFSGIGSLPVTCPHRPFGGTALGLSLSFLAVCFPFPSVGDSGEIALGLGFSFLALGFAGPGVGLFPKPVAFEISAFRSSASFLAVCFPAPG